MLHRKWHTFLRKIEHVENDGLRAAVFAMVDGAYHLDDGFAFVNGFFVAVEADDGEIALYQYAVVHHRMVMPAEFLPGWYLILDGYNFGTTLKIVGKQGSVPALAGANQFGGIYLVIISHFV